MAKDPNYDRYAGIKTLEEPAFPNQPRPIRVGEDGIEIYADDELRRVSQLGEDHPVHLAELGNSNWNGYETMRAQGARDGQALKSGSRVSSQHGPQNGETVGLISRSSRVGTESAKVRARYNPQVRSLGPNDNALREALKGQLREESPSEVRGPLDALFPYKGPKPGSEGRANVPNEAVNRQARVFGKIGKGMGVLGTGLAALDVLQSDNKARAIAANIGAGLGGAVGGAGGAAIGATTGPAAVVAAPAGGIAGAMAGGHWGYEAGEDVYDYVDELLRRGRRW